MYKHCNQIQWGSEIRPCEIRKHLKSGLFEGRISNGPVFKWSGFSYQPFEIRVDQPFGYQTSSKETKMAFICPVFIWLSCLVFKWHLTTRQFGIQPLFDHLNTEQVWYSDSHCFWTCGSSYDVTLSSGVTRTEGRTLR